MSSRRLGQLKESIKVSSEFMEGFMSGQSSDERPMVKELLSGIKEKMPELEELLAQVEGEWAMEDMVYRFYHGSYKVYRVQDYTQKMVEMFRSLLPDDGGDLDTDFLRIISSGTGKSFEMEHNQRWHEETRPLLEAFFHAKYFLQMIVKYGKELENPPTLLPSGWASVLYLYQMR